MKPGMVVLMVIVIVVLLLWAGLKIKPRSFAPFPQASSALQTIPLPEGLPAPVERFYRKVYGDRVPVIDTVVIKGQAVVRPFLNISLPARFIFVHNAGKDYRHYIEATFYGLPVMKVNERYVDGKSLFEMPFGTLEDDPATTQGAVLGLWAEAAWFPAIWVTDARVRWQPIDDHSAVLFVPFGDQEENFVVRFDPETDLMTLLETMRFRDSGPEAKKILWLTQSLEGKNIEGSLLSAVGSATWLDQGKPWAVFTLEEVKYNVDVSQYIRQRGP